MRKVLLLVVALLIPIASEAGLYRHAVKPAAKASYHAAKKLAKAAKKVVY